MLTVQRRVLSSSGSTVSSLCVPLQTRSYSKSHGNGGNKDKDSDKHFASHSIKSSRKNKLKNWERSALFDIDKYFDLNHWKNPPTHTNGANTKLPVGPISTTKNASGTNGFTMPFDITDGKGLRGFQFEPTSQGPNGTHAL
jgi:hypothetical protein